MGTHETQKDQWRLMTIRGTTGDSRRPMGTPETQRDQWRLMRIRENNGDS